MPNYRSPCLLFGLQTLEHRFKVNQCVFVANILKNELDVPYLLEKINIYAPSRPLRSRNLLVGENRRTLYGYNRY